MDFYNLKEINMKKYLLLFVISSTAYTQDLIQIPEVPTATGINKAIAPPKANCESCGEIASLAMMSTFLVPAKIIKEVELLKSQNQCNEGKKRLSHDVSYYVNGGSISETTIGGNWQSGFMSNGTISDLYVGVSAYKDLMFVTKVTNNGKVIGYNVTLSYCEVPNAYPNYPALVSNDRPLTNFQAPYGIILGKDSSCSHGTIAAAMNTVVVSQKNASDVHTSDFPVYSSFTKLSCK